MPRRIFFPLKIFFKKKFLTLSYHVSQLCPTFSSTIIRNILDGFVPDEFCPDPVQDSLLQALESEVTRAYNLCCCHPKYFKPHPKYSPIFAVARTTCWRATRAYDRSHAAHHPSCTIHLHLEQYLVSSATPGRAGRPSSASPTRVTMSSMS
jgi:hypothetical protein